MASIIIHLAKEENIDFTHGVAAKLINIYFKSAFVCGGYHNHHRVKKLHPPIDGLLLDGLKENNVGGRRDRWDLYSKKRWSNFDCDTYESVIADIRASLSADQGLWLIEKYWPGYQ